MGAIAVEAHVDETRPGENIPLRTWAFLVRVRSGSHGRFQFRRIIRQKQKVNSASLKWSTGYQGRMDMRSSHYDPSASRLVHLFHSIAIPRPAAAAVTSWL